MGLIKTIKAQLGISNTPSNNFTLDASAQDGTMKLARGNAGATTQDVMTIAGDGKVDFPAGLAAFVGDNQSLTTNGYQKLPGGLIIQWGSVAVPASTYTYTVTFPIAFPNAALSLATTQGADSSGNSLFLQNGPTKTGFVFSNPIPTILGLRYIAIGH